MEKNNSPMAIFLKILHYFRGFDRPKGSFQTASQIEDCKNLTLDRLYLYI